MKKSISILMAILMVASIIPAGIFYSSALTSGNYDYKVISETEKTAEITKYKGEEVDVIIPDMIDGYKITVIGSTILDGMRNDNSFIESIVMPNSVIEICDDAFSYQYELTIVDMPDFLETLGSGAFYGCINLANVSIPSSVKTVGSAPFYNTAWFSAQPLGVVYLDGWAIDHKVEVFSSEIFEITIAEGTKGIARSTFLDDSKITYVDIPSSVKSIGDYAFAMCRNLSAVRLRNGLEKIGRKAFFDSDKIKSIAVPKTVTEIGEKAIGYNSYFDDVTISDFHLYGFRNSAALQYCTDNQIELKELINGSPTGDSIVDSADAIKILRYDAGLTGFTEYNLLEADVTGDGMVDSADAIKVLRYDAGLTTEL